MYIATDAKWWENMPIWNPKITGRVVQLQDAAPIPDLLKM
jgi:hypothetical protein